MDIKKLKHQLEPLFNKYKNIKFCYCFGSVAENSQSPLSDIDLAFFVDQASSYFDFKVILYTSSLKSSEKFSIAYSPFIDDWNGQVSLKILDIKTHPNPETD